jgi:hypothetical protein
MKISRLSAVGCFLGALCLGLFSYCSLVYSQQYPSGAWRYKMTVEVETPEGIKSGSAVREVSVRTGPSVLSAGDGTSIKAKGDAVVIDLGQRGFLFAILRSPKTQDYCHGVFFDAFPVPGQVGGGATPDGVRYYNQLKQKHVDLPLAEYPDFVRFRDINDPKTVGRVDPANMAASFGEGVKLKDVQIEITDKSVSTGITKVLSWLPSLQGGYLYGGHVSDSTELSHRLHSGDFVKGDLQ